VSESLQPSKPSELKALSTRVVKGPSGFCYRIGMMQVPEMAIVINSEIDFNEPVEKLLSNIDTAERLFDVVEKVLTVCVLEPRVTLMPAIDSIGLNDIPPQDKLMLFTEIVKMAGYTQQNVESAVAFQKDGIGTNNQADGFTATSPTV
jgi:hypothetical protein